MYLVHDFTYHGKSGDKLAESLTVTDNRTGKRYEIPIEDGAIDARELRLIRKDEEDFGLMSYDPGLMNTAICRSSITFIDGEKGILRYRGYPIEQLAEKSTFLEVSYLLLNGELPGRGELDEWVHTVKMHTMLNENMKKLMDTFHYDAHPMAMLISTLAALSSFYPEAKDIFNEESRHKQVIRLIAKTPTIAAFALRHSRGMPYIYPDNDLSYAANFLQMCNRPTTTAKFRSDPVLEKALDTLFILHADHEQNCSTNAMRSVGSSQADPYSTASAAAAALYGPLHGGANEQVLRMLREIGGRERIPALIQQVKEGKRRLMGFGHRVYKNFDPRGKIIKKIADEVFSVTGRNPLIDIALELERVALEDDYFISRKLYPNVDFYSGIIYEAMGFPTSMFPVLFAIGRMPGWLAQWEEMVRDDKQKLVRPRQIYTGHARRDMKR